MRATCPLTGMGVGAKAEGVLLVLGVGGVGAGVFGNWTEAGGRTTPGPSGLGGLIGSSRSRMPNRTPSSSAVL